MGITADYSHLMYRYLFICQHGISSNPASGKALKFMVKNEEGGKGEVSSFGALCTAMSATIGTGNIVGVATALAAGGPGSLFWMVVAAFFWNGNQIFRRCAGNQISYYR